MNVMNKNEMIKFVKYIIFNIYELSNHLKSKENKSINVKE